MDDAHNDAADPARRGLLKCMLWAGTGLVWTVTGGVPRSALMGSAQAATTGTFSARFAYADAGSFFLTLSYAANGCSVTQRWVLLRTG